MYRTQNSIIFAWQILPKILFKPGTVGSCREISGVLGRSTDAATHTLYPWQTNLGFNAAMLEQAKEVDPRTERD